MKEKILFVHVCNEGPPKIKLISTGFIALANFINQKGFECSIINTYVESKLNEKFNLISYIKENDCKIICFSLQWHYQSKAVIDSIKEIKEKLRDLNIILGGRTASFFADEIMEKFDFVDFIIKGYAEIPLLNLVENLNSKNKDLIAIPNLLWRKDNKIIKNKLAYTPTKEILTELSFDDASILKNNKFYDTIYLSEDDKENKFLIIYNCGIGCPVDCSYCSGSKSCQNGINGILNPIMIDPEKAISKLKKIALNGKGIWYTSFDPFPDSDYYIRLFKEIKKENIKLKCKFECWSLPCEEFIKNFSSAFNKDSEIVISPETGSEKIRRANKGYFYTNKELIKSLNLLEENKINSTLFFTAGLPFESKEDFIKTLSLVNFIRRRFSRVKIVSVPIEIEPGSPMFMDEKKFKIKKNRADFMDYYNLKNKPDIGYCTDNLSSEEIVEAANLINIEAKCRSGKSVFLKALTDTLFDPEYFNINEVWNLCSVCNFFKDCFKGSS